jgi:hypothetical protein
MPRDAVKTWAGVMRTIEGASRRSRSRDQSRPQSVWPHICVWSRRRAASVPRRGEGRQSRMAIKASNRKDDGYPSPVAGEQQIAGLRGAVELLLELRAAAGDRSLARVLFSVCEAAHNSSGEEESPASIEVRERLSAGAQDHERPDAKRVARDRGLRLAGGETREAESNTAWLLVLAHLDTEQRAVVEDAYDRALSALEDAAENGHREAEEAGRLLEQQLAPLDDVLDKMEAAAVVRAAATDEHAERRRTRRVEVEWFEDTLVEVLWLDGYEMVVAAMHIYSGGQDAHWTLDVCDPAPGRSVTLDLLAAAKGATMQASAQDAEDPREAARLHRQGLALMRTAAEAELAHAIDWATNELGNQYIVHRDGDGSRDQARLLND